MFRTGFFFLVMAAGFIFGQSTANAQEFPVAVGSDSTFAEGGAFDGTHYLWGLVTNQ